MYVRESVSQLVSPQMHKEAYSKVQYGQVRLSKA